jgi:hypothetical protein
MLYNEPYLSPWAFAFDYFLSQTFLKSFWHIILKFQSFFKYYYVNILFKNPKKFHFQIVLWMLLLYY